MTERDDALSVPRIDEEPLVPSKFEVDPDRLDRDVASVVQAMGATRVETDGVAGVEFVGVET
jgi:hypothetical protein